MTDILNEYPGAGSTDDLGDDADTCLRFQDLLRQLTRKGQQTLANVTQLRNNISERVWPIIWLKLAQVIRDAVK
jgi:hypothetical protein